MNEVLTGNFAPFTWNLWPPRTIRVVDWNIERGLKLPAITEFLAEQKADLVVLQETDVNARRTRQLNVAEELARELGMDYAFGREFQELAEGTKTLPAYTGQATLSRWPIESSRVLHFEQQSGFWHPRWWVPNKPLFQERLGGRIALVTEIRLAGKKLLVYNLHLESRGDDRLRTSQLKEVLDDAGQVPFDTPVIIGGDLNFDTRQEGPSGLVQDAGFSDAFEDRLGATTPRRGLFNSGKNIDRCLVRGPVRGEAGRVHNSVAASDHYPLSFTLRFL